ncbi:MAG: hypothetical protein IKP68_11390 [Clostridia bacterium]|nr:hypothetical protein [Clostridia bacterium]
MKTMKKLIPALAMLLVSAVLLGTSTFAWFSMNTRVTATGMQVVAKSNNTYLLISKTNTTASAIQGENLLTVTLDGPKSLFPAAPCLTSDQADYLTTSGKTVNDATITTAGVQVTNAATAAVVTNWYTATASSSAAATMLTGSARQLVAFTDYVDVQSVYMTVSVGSNTATNLTVTPTFAQVGTPEDGKGDLSAVKAIIITSDGGYAAINSSDNGNAIDIKGSNTPLTSTTVVTVTVYLYVDGDAANVYTNNKANLLGVTLGLQFDVTATPAA